MINLAQLKHSLKYAIKGLKISFKSEQNLRLQFYIATLVIIIAFFLKLSFYDWIIILFLITAVIILEILNTAFEKLIDIVRPKLHHYAGVVKDIMAGAVLLMSVVALLIGLIVFWPYLSKFII